MKYLATVITFVLLFGAVNVLAVSDFVISDDSFPEDGYNFQSIFIEGDILNINISYSGGCQEHLFRLVWDGDFMESSPVQINTYLSHDANEDSCESLIKETLEFNLASLKENYQSVYGGGGNININFQDYQDNEHEVSYAVQVESPLVDSSNDVEDRPLQDYEQPRGKISFGNIFFIVIGLFLIISLIMAIRNFLKRSHD